MKNNLCKTKVKLISGFMAMFCSLAQAQNTGAVKIGVMTDMSSLFSDIGGPGSVVAAQMAIDDFGGKVLGKPIQLISADHQNKPDVAANKAREWYDAEKVSVINIMNSIWRTIFICKSCCSTTRYKNYFIFLACNFCN